MLDTTANKSSILDGGENLCSSSFEPPLASRGASGSQKNPQLLSQQRRTMSGSNALLSLMSQDDFQKLKQEIHTHIDKIGGKIEEIAGQEEEEESEKQSKRPQTASVQEAACLTEEDDDGVILTSARNHRPGTGNRNPYGTEKSSSQNNKTN
jgi:hypothetical protein